ncbi:hypothetical protein [Cohnella candidum]|uniref:Uncharacterized protein n=1 Tax=Cohnella candidum TaxID=2674991 RepID=A0A3G3K545_9BACL|nr:hypothetical protein [Cohnella candidum]AYQ75301.1 hypothetical protein EAV92_23820 [Cohnella candidum]
MQSSAFIEENGLTGTGFADVELAKLLPKDATVDLIGMFDDVSVASMSVKINIPKGSVGNVTVAGGASGNTVDVGNEAKILKLVLNAVIKVTGGGSIDKATVNEGAQGSSFEKKPAEVDGTGKDKIDVTAPFIPIFAGGGGGGGGNGNGNGNGDGGGPSCTQCHSALLSMVTAEGYVWEKRNDQSVRVGTGFDKNIFRYSVETPRDLASSTVPITLTPEDPDAEIVYYISYGKVPIGATPTGTQKGTAHFNIMLKPLEDVDIEVFVTSPNGQGQYYHFIFYYHRTIQEEFLIRSHAFYDEAGQYMKYYSLIADHLVLQPGDKVEVYRKPTDGNPSWTLTVNPGYAFESLSGYHPTSGQDSDLYIKVKRAGSTISEGDYHYDGEPLNVITDSAGVAVRPLNRNELNIASETNPGITNGYEVSFNRDAMGPLLKSAKFIDIYSTPTLGNFPVPYAAVKEDVKQIIPLASPIDIAFLGASYRHYDLEISQVYDSYVYLFLYDEERHPIGYMAILIKYDEEHVSNGATAMKNASPILNPSDVSAPSLSVVSSVVPVGSELVLTSSEEGVAYLVPSGTTYNSRMELQQKVQSGQGTAQAMKTGNLTFMPLNELPAGSWNLYGIDVNGNITSPIAITIGDPAPVPLDLSSTGTLSQMYNNGVILRFNAQIENNKENMASLKASISFANDGVNFQPLTADDTVSTVGDLLFITFGQPYTGTVNRIKIAHGALKNKQTQEALAQDIISPAFAEGPIVTVPSSPGPVILNNIGDSFTFMVDRPSTIYLTPFGSPLTPENLEQLIAQGKALKIVITQETANQLLSLATTGLSPGRYLFIALGGGAKEVRLAITPTLVSNQVQLHNVAGVEDEIIVSQITEGDVIRVRDFMNPLGIPVKTEIVPPGKSTITITGVSLDDTGGILSITRESVGKAESDPSTFYYPPVAGQP